MTATTVRIPTTNGVELFAYAWEPATSIPRRGIVQIAHGLAEHAARYARLAAALAARGYVVVANDHRGHGRTARTEDELGFFAATDGWRHVVDDVGRVGAHARAAYPDLPLVLFGHSMGSFFVQDFLCDHGATLAGAVLSGSTANLPAPELLALARAEAGRVGSRGRSDVLAAHSFGAFNSAFEPVRTAFDWLSRDDAEVDAYVADPFCGFVATPQLWIDLLEAAPALGDPARLARIPSTLPIYILAGDRDPVNADLQGLNLLLEWYRTAGLERVTHRFYPGGRHEMLNETNRADVVADLLAWLDGVTA